MGWSLRKSVSFGPLRLNFSKSGISTSVGVKGARVSFGKRGTYVTLGTNGIYYRQRIDVPGFTPPVPEPSNTFTYTENAAKSTTDVEKVTDVDSKQFIEELESKARTITLLPIGVGLSIACAILGLAWLNQTIESTPHYGDIFTVSAKVVRIRQNATQNSVIVSRGFQDDQYKVVSPDSSGWIAIYLKRNPDVIGFIRSDLGSISSQLAGTETRRIETYPSLKFVYGAMCITLIVMCVFLQKKDVARKTLEITYAIDGAVKDLYEKFLASFQEFSNNQRVWQKLNRHFTTDIKYHAGASELISRARVSGIYEHKLPSPFLRTNVNIPCIQLRNTELYFFPERLILKQGNRFGASFYKNISIKSSQVRFVEEDSVPGDATIVDYTWRYTNKNGGPDRRFSDNKQIPVCLYTEYEFYSENGINEVITTSKNMGMNSFSEFIQIIGKFQKSLQTS